MLQKGLAVMSMLDSCVFTLAELVLKLLPQQQAAIEERMRVSGGCSSLRQSDQLSACCPIPFWLQGWHEGLFLDETAFMACGWYLLQRLLGPRGLAQLKLEERELLVDKVRPCLVPAAWSAHALLHSCDVCRHASSLATGLQAAQQATGRCSTSCLLLHATAWDARQQPA